MDNGEVADLLEEYAHLRQRAGDRPYRITAYRRAAATIALAPLPVLARLRKGWDPQELAGVGPAIAGVLREMAETGTWQGLEASRARLSSQAMAPTWKGRRKSAKSGSIQLRGDLHAHTTATDGRDSIDAMAQAGQALGYEYLAITDHSKKTRIAGGLDASRMRRHLGRIRRISDRLDGITLLAGAEVDILRDGRLDFPDTLLRDMDVVVCSVHFRHRLPGPEQTERILRAMCNEHADILGHPSGRREGIRPGMEIDLVRIIEAAKAQGWAIEMNGSPERIDMDAEGARLAARRGVLVACDSDAHSTAELGQVRNALRQAQIADLRSKDVLNALPLAKLLKWLGN